LAEFRTVEAEAYYGEAVAVEEKANRTHFAAGKKREALLEALKLYTLAVACGKDEAQPKVFELEKKIHQGDK